MTPDQSTSRLVPVYEALALDIKNMGIATVFGLMSDDTAHLVATLDAVGVRFCEARHENMAAAMAEGYAAATGKVGIAIMGRGPATANALHGAVFASRTGSRVLLIFGEGSVAPPKINAFGPDNKTFAGPAVIQAAGLRMFVAQNATGARQTLADAVAATESGAAVLLLPTNVQLALMPNEVGEPKLLPVKTPPRPARPAAVKVAASLLAKASRPLIICGQGAHHSGARAIIERLADRTGAIVATTMKAKDMFAGYDYNAGVIGSLSQRGGRKYMDQADCVLAIGASMNMRTTSFGQSVPSDAPLIQIDVDRAHIGRWCQADVSLVGDAKTIVEQLIHALPDDKGSDKPFRTADVARQMATHDPATEFETAHTAHTVDPRSLAIELNRMLPQKRNLVYDNGNFFQVGGYLSVPGPQHIKLCSDFASIGMGLGTAIGFGIGQPDFPTVLVVGDGGFLMTMGELETAAREGVRLVVILMNDGAYGAERHFLEIKKMPVRMAQHPNVDFAPIAEGFGFEATTIRSMDDLKKLAPQLIDPQGPILLDCKINGNIVAPFLVEALDQQR